MNDELVVALAKRLKLARDEQVKQMGQADFNGYSTVDLAVARECLRQMEWARRQTVTIELGVILAARERGVEKVATFQPMTLAPEDWKP